jgi:hypothetical protein
MRMGRRALASARGAHPPAALQASRGGTAIGIPQMERRMVAKVSEVRASGRGAAIEVPPVMKWRTVATRSDRPRGAMQNTEGGEVITPPNRRRRRILTVSEAVPGRRLQRGRGRVATDYEVNPLPETLFPAVARTPAFVLAPPSSHAHRRPRAPHRIRQRSNNNKRRSQPQSYSVQKSAPGRSA